MKIILGDVFTLLTALAARTGEVLDYSGLGVLSLKINQFHGQELISHRYLHENLYLRVMDPADHALQSKISMQKLDLIAAYLGYANFLDFLTKEQRKKLSPQLQSCLGDWFSVVRCNASRSHLLISSVQIFQQDEAIRLSLQGRFRTFVGAVQIQGGCLMSFTQSQEEKELHHVFRIGLAYQPNVLQGVYSGVSSAGYPICGRALLIRKTETQSQHAPAYARLSFAEVASCTWLDGRLVPYFNAHLHEYVKVQAGGSFELDDLIPGEGAN